MSHRSFFITLSSSDCAKHLTGVPDKVKKAPIFAFWVPWVIEGVLNCQF